MYTEAEVTIASDLIKQSCERIARKERILQFIADLRGDLLPEIEAEINVNDTEAILTLEDCASPIIKEVFMRGNCGNFALALMRAFPGGSVLFVGENGEHCCYEFEGTKYDILGELTSERFYTDYDGVIMKSTTDEDEVRNSDNYGNYSFNNRGPII